MQSDTKPLPAQTLLALADDRIRSLCHSLLDIADRTTGDISMNARMAAVCASEYSSARSASSVTREEAVLAEYHNAKEAERDMKMAGLCPDRCNPAVHHRRVNAETAVSDNARRLAGEGGAA